MPMFRDLKAEEIECRIAQINGKGLSLLLYKDARVDMNILDETVGPMNWQRKHLRDNANCIVSIWDAEKGAWIEKEDTGTESFTEKEKGICSDSMKRACFNWGIGRELYTAPFIWISADKCNLKVDGNKYKCFDNFFVSKINITEKKIIGLEVFNGSTKKVAFAWGELIDEEAQKRARIIVELLEKAGQTKQTAAFMKKFNISNWEELSIENFNFLKRKLEERIESKDK